MSSFEFAFSLFGLLLGLALAEGLGGLAKSLKARHRVRIGWPTALLALLVSCDLVTFWAYAWTVREAVPATFPALFFGFLVTGIYYLAASLVFPDDPGACGDLDAHFMQHRREVLAGMFAANALLLGATIALLGWSTAWSSPRALIVTWSFLPLSLIAMFARDRRVILGAIIALLLLYPLSAMWR